MIAWKQLVKLEPKLKGLETEALKLHERRNDWRAWERLKRGLKKLVGWWTDAPNDVDSRLLSGEAWKTANDHLLYCRDFGRLPEQPVVHDLPSPAEIERLSQPAAPTQTNLPFD
ncbi:MAG: hypothetical protein ACYTG0_06065 [Planctomycetota bacterium]|jgi:hypothetical protein